MRDSGFVQYLLNAASTFLNGVPEHGPAACAPSGFETRYAISYSRHLFSRKQRSKTPLGAQAFKPVFLPGSAARPIGARPCSGPKLLAPRLERQAISDMALESHLLTWIESYTSTTTRACDSLISAHSICYASNPPPTKFASLGCFEDPCASCRCQCVRGNRAGNATSRETGRRKFTQSF